MPYFHISRKLLSSPKKLHYLSTRYTNKDLAYASALLYNKMVLADGAIN